MSSGRIQVASVGIQDLFLTGNPEVTYFKQRFSRHTKFGLETLDNPFDEVVNWGQVLKCVIPRKGDLIRNMYLRIKLPRINSPNYGYTNSIGNAIIEWADLIIGGQLIERITGEYMEIYNQLYITDSQQGALKEMVGTTDSLTGLGAASGLDYPRTFLVPLPFYFHRVESLNIPLCALTYQEVEINIKLRGFSDIFVNVGSGGGAAPILPTSSPDISLPTEYVFLKEEEVNFFKTSRLDYGITQVQIARQRMEKNINQGQFRLNFINPVKELYMVIQSNVAVENNDLFNYSNPDSNTTYPKYHNLENLELSLNGNPIIKSDVADALFLFAAQSLYNHTRLPSVVSNCLVYNYSFSIDPEYYQPTGQVNMSRIENQLIKINLTDSPSSEWRDIRIYALSYNILRIEHGLSGMLFIDNNRN